jgi:hypothetical protein
MQCVEGGRGSDRQGISKSSTTETSSNLWTVNTNGWGQQEAREHGNTYLYFQSDFTASCKQILSLGNILISVVAVWLILVYTSHFWQRNKLKYNFLFNSLLSLNTIFYFSIVVVHSSLMQCMLTVKKLKYKSRHYMLFILSVLSGRCRFFFCNTVVCKGEEKCW